MRYSLSLSFNFLTYWRRYFPFYTSRTSKILTEGGQNNKPFKNRDLVSNWTYPWSLEPLYCKFKKKFDFGFDSTLYLIKEERKLISNSKMPFNNIFLKTNILTKDQNLYDHKLVNWSFIFDLSRGGLGGGSTHTIFSLGSYLTCFKPWSFRLTSSLLKTTNLRLVIFLFISKVLLYTNLIKNDSDFGFNQGVGMLGLVSTNSVLWEGGSILEKNQPSKLVMGLFFKELLILRFIVFQVCLF